jgi:hypothetical protein
MNDTVHVVVVDDDDDDRALENLVHVAAFSTAFVVSLAARKS